ncbi:hypothetical protein BR93DRAFT_967577 [Coniochaeta sp. PMI_546]|nr:hypothetical protein BR93DRAFT_967577 [Coniochaeta sp. PMI_546]
MSDQNSDLANSRTSSNLSFELQQLRMKLTEPPRGSNPSSPAQPPGIHFSDADTLETVLLLCSSTEVVENPLREVYFPHWRVGAPGTTKCVGRPDRPKLAVNTDVPAVSISRYAHRYGTPWRSAAPARYGPPEMNSAEMCTWLKGPKEETDTGKTLPDPSVDFEDDDGPWFEIDLKDYEDGDGPWSEIDLKDYDETAQTAPGQEDPADQEEASSACPLPLESDAKSQVDGKQEDDSGPASHGCTDHKIITQDLKYEDKGSWARRPRKTVGEKEIEAYWAQ